MKARHSTPKKASKRRKQGFKTGREQQESKKALRAVNQTAIQVFEPNPGIVYSIEMASQLAHVPRRRILIYCKEQLISPTANPDVAGYWFDADALRTLKRIEELRAICCEPLAGVGLILNLMREVQRLRAEMRALEV
jgi:hypothetical protein